MSMFCSRSTINLSRE